MRFLFRVLAAEEDFVSLAELEDSLLRNVFRGYQKWVRPVQHANDTITVRFGLKISQLVDVVRNGEVMRKVGIVFFLIFYSWGEGLVCQEPWVASISPFSSFDF